MPTWTTEELNTIGEAEELELATLQRDGTPRKPVTIWVVRAGDDLFIRPINGREGAWYRGVLERHEGRIETGGVARDVSLEEAGADPALNGQIDAAYRAKYHRYAKSIVDTVLTPRARAATLKLVPRA